MPEPRLVDQSFGQPHCKHRPLASISILHISSSFFFSYHCSFVGFSLWRSTNTTVERFYPSLLHSNPNYWRVQTRDALFIRKREERRGRTKKKRTSAIQERPQRALRLVSASQGLRFTLYTSPNPSSASFSRSDYRGTISVHNAATTYISNPNSSTNQ
jgi:hypothetical protein